MDEIDQDGRSMGNRRYGFIQGVWSRLQRCNEPLEPSPYTTH